MKKLLFSLAIVFLATVIIISSCKKKEDDPEPDPIPTKVSISGTVYDENGVALAGVAITANDKTGTSSATGTFSITDITKPSGKLAVYFKKANYISASRFETVSSTLSISVSLINLTSGIAATANFDATAACTLSTSNGTNVNLPANSIYKDASGGTYSGTVTLNMAYVDPTSSNYDRLLEGSSQMLDDGGKQLESFGVLKVELMDANGNPIIFETDSLTKSMGATVGVVIPSTKLSASPETVILYSYNSTKSAYVSSGVTASKVNGQYVGTVSHFSSWNCAIQKPTDTTSTTSSMQYKFDNVLKSNFDTIQAYVLSDTSGTKTIINCSGPDGTISFQLTVQQTGSYEINNFGYGYIRPNTTQMLFGGGSIIIISKFEQVGGLIAGTFFGNSADTTSHSISNGVFSIVRTADQ